MACTTQGIFGYVARLSRCATAGPAEVPMLSRASIDSLKFDPNQTFQPLLHEIERLSAQARFRKRLTAGSRTKLTPNDQHRLMETFVAQLQNPTTNLRFTLQGARKGGAQGSLALSRRGARSTRNAHQAPRRATRRQRSPKQHKRSHVRRVVPVDSKNSGCRKL